MEMRSQRWRIRLGSQTRCLQSRCDKIIKDADNFRRVSLSPGYRRFHTIRYVIALLSCCWCFYVLACIQVESLSADEGLSVMWHIWTVAICGRGAAEEKEDRLESYVSQCISSHSSPHRVPSGDALTKGYTRLKIAQKWKALLMSAQTEPVLGTRYNHKRLFKSFFCSLHLITGIDFWCCGKFHLRSLLLSSQDLIVKWGKKENQSIWRSKILRLFIIYQVKGGEKRETIIWV